MIKLDDVCHISSGGTPSRHNTEFYQGIIPWAKISDIENAKNGILTETEETITEAGLRSIGNRIFPKGTLLFAMYGSIGKVAIAGRELATNQAILGIRPRKEGEIHLAYLKIWFEQNKQKLINQGRGVALQNLSATIIRNLEISLPILSNQIRIATVLSKAEALIAQRKESLKLLDGLLKSTFLEMFGDPVRNEKNLEKVALGKLGIWKSGGTPLRSKKEYFNGRIPWITSGELNDLYISDSKEKITEEAILKSNASKIEVGSLLLGMYDTAALKSSITGLIATCNQAIAYSKLDDRLCNTLFVYFNIQIGKDFLKSQQRGVRQQNMNLSMIKGLNILYPPLALQNQFAEIVEKVETLKIQYKASLLELENLYASLSQKAFKGELDLSKVLIKEPRAFSSDKGETPAEFFAQLQLDELVKEDAKNQHSIQSDDAIPETPQDMAYYGIPEELPGWRTSNEQYVAFYEKFLKKHFSHRAFTQDQVEELFTQMYAPGGLDFQYELFKKVVLKALQEKDSFLRQSFDEKEKRIKLEIIS